MGLGEQTCFCTHLRGVILEVCTGQFSCYSGKHPGPGVVTPNIYPNYDLLECGKGLILRNHNFSISSTWGNIRMTDWNLGGDSITDHVPKPKAVNLTNSLLINEHLQIKLPVAKRWIKKSWRGAKDGGAKCFTFIFCLFLFLFIFHLIFILH